MARDRTATWSCSLARFKLTEGAAEDGTELLKAQFLCVAWGGGVWLWEESVCSGAGEFSSGLIIHSLEYQMVLLGVFFEMETGGRVGAQTR